MSLCEKKQFSGENSLTIKLVKKGEAHMQYFTAFIFSIFLFTSGSLQASSPMISGGGYHSLALKSDGTVWSWGRNNFGQLGNGKHSKKNIPVLVKELEDVIAIAAGTWHSMALKSDGTVWTWGLNNYGQLGDGTFRNRKTPVQVKNLTDVIAIAGGYLHSLALKSDGTVWAWGSNWSGQLGNETIVGASEIPIQVNSLSNISAIACGGDHSLAIRSSDGTIWAWGNNFYGQLGNGSGTNTTAPVLVNGLSDVSKVNGGYIHSLALVSDGSVWTWGNNRYGQLGDGSTREERRTPVQVMNIDSITSISARGWHNLALHSEGKVFSWGNNSNGQLGDGTRTERHIPVEVKELEDITDISTGWQHSLALKSDGTVWAWGDNKFGQLGDGTFKDRKTPVPVKNFSVNYD